MVLQIASLQECAISRSPRGRGFMRSIILEDQSLVNNVTNIDAKTFQPLEGRQVLATVLTT